MTPGSSGRVSSRFWRFPDPLRVAGVGTPPPEALQVGLAVALLGWSTDPGHLAEKIVIIVNLGSSAGR